MSSISTQSQSQSQSQSQTAPSHRIKTSVPPSSMPSSSTPIHAVHEHIHLEKVRRIRHPSSIPNGPPSYTYEYDPTDTFDVKRRAPYEISAWHDIPVTVYDLKTHTPVDDHVNGITLIPKWTRIEYMMKKNILHTPIEPVISDEKRGVVKQFAYGDVLFNTGILPQTWSDPNHQFDIELAITTPNVEGTEPIVTPQKISRKGNDEPLSYIELGTQQRDTATIYPIKVLGCLPLIDANKDVMDFKVVGIHYEDPLADEMNEIDDVTRVLPGALPAIQNWYIHYREPEGKPTNIVAGSDYMTANDAWRLINTAHGAWHKHFRQRRQVDQAHWHKV